MSNIITESDVEWITLLWKKIGGGDDTEVVELIDDMTGKRSILIKEKKK